MRRILTCRVLTVEGGILLPFAPSAYRRIYRIFRTSSVAHPKITRRTFRLFRMRLILFPRTSYLSHFRMATIYRVNSVLNVFKDRIRPKGRKNNSVFQVGTACISALHAKRSNSWGRIKGFQCRRSRHIPKEFLGSLRRFINANQIRFFQ